MAWFSPYVLASEQVDTRSFDTILSDPRFRGKSGEELAVALWQWLVDPHEGFYHHLCPTEELDEVLTGDSVKDPVRLLNCYGYGLCGLAAILFMSLYDWAGGQARMVGIPGHTISEAHWDGAWHLLDCDLRAVHYKKTADGFEVASLEDLVADPDLVANPVRRSQPYYRSDEHARQIAEICYRPGTSLHFPRYMYRLGSMDYVLRPGESLTYHYQPQGRFYWAREWAVWVKGERLKSFAGPVDPKDPNRRYAAACIRWRPDLHADLDEVGIGVAGFERAPGGLVAGDEGGVLTYRLVSPYVICGRHEGGQQDGRRVDGLLLRLNATAAPRVRITTPRDGVTAEADLHRDGDEHIADLTRWADLHYEYELTVSLAAGQTLRNVMVETWCQASQAALPAWCRPGRQVRLAAGSAWEALRGRPVLPHVVDLIRALRAGGDEADLRGGQLQDSPLHKIRPEGAELVATAAVAPPLPGRIVRLYVMAGVASSAHAAGAEGRVVLEMAPDAEGPFEQLACEPVAVDPQEFYFSVEGIAVLPGASKVWLRLRSGQSVGAWRVRLDYEPGDPGETSGGEAARDAAGDLPLHLLFRWRQDGRLRTVARLAASEQGQSFVVVEEAGEVQPMHLVLSVPSRGASSRI